MPARSRSGSRLFTVGGPDARPPSRLLYQSAALGGASAVTVIEKGLLPHDEEARIDAVRRYDILDTPPDDIFDRIAAVAARLFDVPIALISVVDTDRIWFKSHHGLPDVSETARDPGLCASAILHTTPWVVTDMAADHRTFANELMDGEFGLRFYAGMPLTTPDGHNLGTLCVIGRKPREVSPAETANLQDLARLVMDEFEARLVAQRAVATATESSRLTAQRLAAETASATEASRVTAETLAVRTASAAEAFRVTAERLAAETAAATEAFRLTAETLAAETASATEASRVTAETLAAKTASATEASRVTAETLAAETASAIEASRITAETLAAETASATEDSRVTAETLAAETASATEALQITAETLAAKTASATEASRVTAETLAAETASATDQADRERLTAQAERERLESQLHQSQRLESLGQLAGGVAHDFNNLLGAILNYASFVGEEIATVAEADDTRDWASVQRDVGQIQRAAERAAQLTRQLLAFARREVVQPQVLILNEVVSEVQQLLVRTIGEHVELTTSLMPGLWPVLADRGHIEQVLVNLAVNARDAMPGGGTLTIATENVNVDELYAATTPGVVSGRHVRLRVCDTGPGMDPEVLQRAFEPFFTTKPRGEGSGLGLATVYGIITQSGGHAHIYSEPGLGVAISALFPATEQAAPTTDQATAPRATGGGETVLVVEDEEGMRDVTERILARNGYRVLSAANGLAAVELIEGHPGQIDLLLTDVVMPQMLGKEVAERISALQPAVRVLYMSGYALPVLGAQGTLDAGVTLVEKPFTAPVLLAKVREVLERPVPHLNQ